MSSNRIESFILLQWVCAGRRVKLLGSVAGVIRLEYDAATDLETLVQLSNQLILQGMPLESFVFSI